MRLPNTPTQSESLSSARAITTSSVWPQWKIGVSVHPKDTKHSSSRIKLGVSNLLTTNPKLYKLSPLLRSVYAMFSLVCFFGEMQQQINVI